MILHKGVAPAKLTALVALLAAIPLGALMWLAWGLIEQDRALELQRLERQLDEPARLVKQELDLRIRSWEDRLDLIAQGGLSEAPGPAVILTLTANGVTRHQGAPIAFLPAVAPDGDLPLDALAAAEAREFRDRNPRAAALLYRGLAFSANRRVRAAALVGLARCLEREGRLDDAVTVYGELAGLGATTVSEFPAELVARRERARIFETLGDAPRLSDERRALAAALDEGRFRIDRATYEFFDGRQDSREHSTRSLVLAGAAQALWPSWLGQPSGRATWQAGGDVYVTSWRPAPGGTIAAIDSIDTLTAGLAALEGNLGIRVALVAPDSTRLWGDAQDAAQFTRTIDDTALPWSLQVSTADYTSRTDLLSSRHTVMLAAFAVMAVAIVVAAYSVSRAVAHEVRIARLQADFLAAVSHEFRTPLSAMSHLAEVLQDGRGSAGHLQDYYRAIAVETRRLQGLVEGLLDFGRTEAGGRVYEQSEVDVPTLVASVTGDYRTSAGLAKDRIELHLPNEPVATVADREALALVIRNLIDNAVKYSPPESPVRVSVARAGSGINIGVDDEGPGIPKAEQRDVFRKFVRGGAARDLGVKGTGIGLAMAAHIVRAHGGRISLESEAGRGSRFTVHLPAVVKARGVEAHGGAGFSRPDLGGLKPAPSDSGMPGSETP